ncbi:MAG: HAMP domain-containing histidine kinase [Anaerolineae bacterium]|jgi:signal transduction histidine kinase|nr:HAMP domain-containing histidine kinase [Anaerolineae bacterium]
MHTDPTDTAFLADVALLASEPVTDKAVQAILQLTVNSLGIMRLVCRAEVDGYSWVVSQPGHTNDLIATEYSVPLTFRDKVLGDLRASVPVDSVASFAVITRLLSTVLRDRELDLAEKAVQNYRDRMVRLVTHDLRTPLAQVIGYVSLLEMDLGEMPEQMRFVEGIQSAAAQMEKLLESMMRLERLRHSPRDLYTRVSLYQMAGGVLQDCRYPALQKGVQLAADLEPNPLAMVEGDEFLIQRAMENLVNNAIKFTMQDGRVTMRLTFESNRVVYSVEDTGIGIHKEHLDDLFTPFHQIKHDDQNPSPPGFGLGLSLVGSIVQQHGGDVFVRSTIGVGSTFGFWLPLVP